jgi:hypothetical protein
MDAMDYCDMCEMDRQYCEHGLAERQGASSAVVSELLIAPSGKAHFPGCPHKGDHPDYSRWATLETPRACERLGNGENLGGTGGGRPDLIATARCKDCLEHGPW